MKAVCQLIASLCGSIAVGMSVVGFGLGMFTAAQLVVVVVCTAAMAFAIAEL